MRLGPGLSHELRAQDLLASAQTRSAHGLQKAYSFQVPEKLRILLLSCIHWIMTGEDLTAQLLDRTRLGFPCRDADPPLFGLLGVRDRY